MAMAGSSGVELGGEAPRAFRGLGRRPGGGITGDHGRGQDGLRIARAARSAGARACHAIGRELQARGLVPARGGGVKLRRRGGSNGRGVVFTSASAATASKRGMKMSDNAIAGAIAGSLVSVCLHPIDTIKVMVQAEAGNRSLPVVLGNFIKKRGVGSLYSGLSTNLTTSAPISAIYTSTYEAVKERLLPTMPADKKWVAHCIAGGCASVATSFVYTPSACIQQRLQVGQYKSPIAAGLGIIRKEGLGTLYGGWTAVLCRNVPQSVIKFLTYEQLKNAARRVNGGEEPSTAQTLLIGGISGSTAAFVTTPFDVIKTRLQTQAAVPGQGVQYKGVLQTLKGITKTEGISGLYRGVTPRLFIYVSQGAIFFASYEVMKRVIHLRILKEEAAERESRNGQVAKV